MSSEATGIKDQESRRKLWDNEEEKKKKKKKKIDKTQVLFLDGSKEE